MPKTKISEYSTTNSANTDIESINIDEGCAPSGINNAIRELMVHLKEFQTGSSGDPLTVAGTFVASGGATLSGTNTLSGSTVMTASAGTSASPSIHFSSDTNTGIFSPAADTIAFAEGGAEAMRIDSSGNVGIGTTSPSNRLHVSAGNGDVVRISGTTRSLYFGADSSGMMVATGAGQTGVGTYYSAGSDFMYFMTGSTERARITSGGDLLVGTTTTNPHSTGTYGTQLSVGGILVGVNNSHAIIAARWNGDGEVIRLQRNNTDVGSIDVTTTATSYNTSSDYRLKENVQPMTGALAKVSALNPVTYTWKSNGSASQGFIAHELQEIVPECVTGEKDAVDSEGNPQYQGVDTSFLVATLTAAIQELKAELDAAKVEIEALKG
jgi:hypothetical protein